jgi:hypothetical protein
MKVVPLPPTATVAAASEPWLAAWSDDVSIHHSPDKYVVKDGVSSSHNFFLTLDTLLEWTATCPAAPAPLVV